MIIANNLFKHFTHSNLFLPKVAGILMILISCFSFRIEGMPWFKPSYEVIFIYYWCNFRPNAIPTWFVFLLGVIQDSLYGMPLGTSSFTNLVLQGFIISQRRIIAKKPFMVVWIGFILTSLFTEIFKWGLACLIFDYIFSIEYLVVEWLLTVAIYAWIHAFFNLIYYLTAEEYN